MTEERWEERAVLTRLAEASRVTQAMKRDGTRGGRPSSSTAGVALSEGEVDESEALREEREFRMPERIAIPNVPAKISISAHSPSTCFVKLAAS